MIVYCILRLVLFSCGAAHKLYANKLHFPKRGLIVLVCLATPNPLTGQITKLNYTIIRENKEVGYMHITKTEFNTSNTVESYTEVLISKLLDIRMKETKSVTEQNGIVSSTTASRSVSGYLKVTTATNYQHGIYNKSKNGNVIGAVIDPIHSTVLQMHFKEPVNCTSVYSEYFQLSVPVNKTGKGIYQLSYPDGTYSIYRYSGGRCTSVKAITRYGVVTLVLVPEIQLTSNE
ncbi:MAG TPA: DUF6134 family protein [Bacteroidia bacterium]|nr:DUF6134 family protein [Bacteroidia bacterium]